MDLGLQCNKNNRFVKFSREKTFSVFCIFKEGDESLRSLVLEEVLILLLAEFAVIK